jgi:hypothetical protein
VTTYGPPLPAAGLTLEIFAEHDSLNVIDITKNKITNTDQLSSVYGK